MIIRHIRTLFWLEWRLMVNTLRSGRQRGQLENISRTTDTIAPIVRTILTLPAIVVLAVAGMIGGWFLAQPGEPPVVVVLFVMGILMVPTIWVLLRSFIQVARHNLTRSDLLRLLPIPKSLLRHLELIRVFTDPIFLVFIGGSFTLPFGVMAAGRIGLAALALLAGVCFWGLLASAAAVISLAVQLLLRNRQRQEVAAFIVMVVFCVMGFLPQFINHHDADSSPTRQAIENRKTARINNLESPQGEEIPKFFHYVPSGLYAETLSQGVAGHWGSAAEWLGLLAVMALAMYALGAPLHRQLMETPAGGSSVSAKDDGRVVAFAIPFVPAAVAAVGIIHYRAFLRTVHGKRAVVSPALLLVIFYFLSHGGGHNLPSGFSGPYFLAGIAVFVCLNNLQVFVSNQFAVAGEGLVLEFLLPLSPRVLVLGRVLTGVLIAASSLLPAMILLAVFFSSYPFALWPAFFLGALSANLLVAPLDTFMSALFPKTVDLSRMGRAGRPHGLPTLVHLFGGVAASLPAAAMIVFSLWLFNSAWLALLLNAGLVMLAGASAVFAAGKVSAVIPRRRENLALVATGR